MKLLGVPRSGVKNKCVPFFTQCMVMICYAATGRNDITRWIVQKAATLPMP